MDIKVLSATELEAEVDRLQSLVGVLRVQLHDANSGLATLRSELDRRACPPESAPKAAPPARVCRVTDHAVLRYIERVLEFDVEAVRERMLTGDVRVAMAAGASMVVVDGAQFKLDGHKVVTVMTRHYKPKRASKSGRRPGISAERAIREGLGSVGSVG